MTDIRPRFHLAFPVDDLDAARHFYADILGCGIGRESSHWLDFDFHGHQIVAHLSVEDSPVKQSDVDGDKVPVRHFGLILDWQSWHEFVDHLRAAKVEFLVEPKIRFAGQAGEQATLFVSDPSGNALEFKSFRDDSQVFARDATSTAAVD